MDRGRILILGNSKENTYEIRNLLDNRKFELEIALGPDIGKSILTERWMNLLIIHTEAIDERCSKLFEFLSDRDIEIPILIVGDEAKKFRDLVPARTEVTCIEKPYRIDEMLNFIQTL